MKIVREHIYEAFSEKGDPIKDMGIGIKPLIEQIYAANKKHYSDLYDVYKLFKENEENPLQVFIKGNIDHPLSGYRRAFNEIEIDGTVTLDPNTRKVIIDAKTVLITGDMLKYSDEDSYYKDEDEDEDWDDDEDDDSYTERDYDNADHEYGSWQQEFNSVEEFVKALEDAAA